MKKLLLLIAFTCLGSYGHAQNALTMLKFEDAEKAFNNGNYAEALQHLNDVEKAAGVTSKTLYLRTVIENKQFDNGSSLYTDKSQFEQLQRVRQHAAKYLKALSKQGIDDKYREIYRISENLAAFPKTMPEWEKGKQAHLELLARQKQQQQEAQRLALEKLKEDELKSLLWGQITIDQLRYNEVARISDDSSAKTAVVYFMRPKEGSRSMVHSIILNGATVIKKIKEDEYVKLYFTPGLLKVGEITAKNKSRMSKGGRIAAIATGGVVGLVATSGKIVAKSTVPFGLRLESGKTYYVSSLVLKNKTIFYKKVDESIGKKALEHMKKTDK